MRVWDAAGRLLSRIGVEKRFTSSHHTFLGKHLPDEQLVCLAKHVKCLGW